jgi:hypothetical protein
VAALDDAFAKLLSELVVWSTETISSAPPAPAPAPAPPVADTQPSSDLPQLP